MFFIKKNTLKMTIHSFFYVKIFFFLFSTRWSWSQTSTKYPWKEGLDTLKASAFRFPIETNRSQSCRTDGILILTWAQAQCRCDFTCVVVQLPIFFPSFDDMALASSNQTTKNGGGNEETWAGPCNRMDADRENQDTGAHMEVESQSSSKNLYVDVPGILW